MRLNDFHETNALRQEEAFAPGHRLVALVVCVGEEVGELCAAVLGVTGEKKRKKHLTNADVRDAVYDAQAYLSLVLWRLGVKDLQGQLDHVPMGRQQNLFMTVLEVQASQGRLASHVMRGHHSSTIESATLCFKWLIHVAEYAGAEDWQRELGQTFNMVSDRCGSKYKVEL